MKTVKSTEIHEHMGEYLDEARREPVTITRYGRPSVVMISPELYDRWRAIEDKMLLQAAREAEEEGYLSVEESHRALGFEAPAETDEATASTTREE